MRYFVGMTLALATVAGCSSGNNAPGNQVSTTQAERLQQLDKVPLQGDQRQKVMTKFGGTAERH